MIQLLFMVVLMEGIVVLLLMVKIGPLRELVMKGLDQMKMGKGPATVKTIACTMGVILASSVISIFKIQNKGVKIGSLSPMDQVLWRTHLLEASLIGYSLFLGYVIDRLHHYLCKLVELKETVGASRKEVQRLQKENLQLKEKEDGVSKEIKLLKEEIANLEENLKKMKSESEEKDTKILDSEAHVVALQKQMEGILLEYDHLLEDNQALQCQTHGYRI